MSYAVLVNGRGNAWPIEVGAPCGPGSRSAAVGSDLREYANTSFSIVRESAAGNLVWSVLVDVGMGVIPALVQSGNRLPDAVVLTHPHLDRIAGLDWLIANNGRYGKRPLPVYASEACYNEVLTRFPWLRAGMVFKPFSLGQFIAVDTAPGLRVKALPVFHGDYAPGACMVLAVLADATTAGGETRVLFTGDLLCPLLRKADLDELQGLTAVFADANTRFPWPNSNHWSITIGNYQHVLQEWSRYGDAQALLKPHEGDMSAGEFLAQFLAEQPPLFWAWAIDEFVKAIQPKNVSVVHYSGYEDAKHHDKAILTDEDLLTWLHEGGVDTGAAQWHIPRPGEITTIDPGARLTWHSTWTCRYV